MGVTGRILPPNTDFEHARVWPTLFRLRFFGPRQTYRHISREISIEHPSVGLASLAQLCCRYVSYVKSRGNHVNQTRACSKSVLGGKIRPVTPILFVSSIA